MITADRFWLSTDEMEDRGPLMSGNCNTNTKLIYKCFIVLQRLHYNTCTNTKMLHKCFIVMQRLHYNTNTKLYCTKEERPMGHCSLELLVLTNKPLAKLLLFGYKSVKIWPSLVKIVPLDLELESLQRDWQTKYPVQQI